MLSKETVIEQIFHDCMKEMYEKSQPSANYDQLLEDVRTGKINKSERIYERYYLSQEEFKYIQNKYLEAYRIKGRWKEYVEIVEDYFKKGGTRDKWIPKQVDDTGFKQLGYRGYEKVPSIDVQIEELIKNSAFYTGNEEDIHYLVEDITLLILNNIRNCKEFYKFDIRDENYFCCSTALGCSPTSNPQTVIDYWKTQGIDIKIEKRNPLLFWEKDYYGNNFEEIMEDEYGPDWKNIWNYKLKKEQCLKK